MLLLKNTVHCGTHTHSPSKVTTVFPIMMTVEQESKKKVVFILGATATGKTRMSIDIATRFPAEIINSDKIQMYKGLDIITNKLNDQDMKQVPHHLLSVLDDPNEDYTATDFCQDAFLSLESILKFDRIPIIVGGSNSFIEALVELNPRINFKQEFDSCFIWMDVSTPILFSRISTRVDEMVESGLIDELSQLDFSSMDFSKGIFRSIGVEELQNYFIAKKSSNELDDLPQLLREGIEEVKTNTCRLAAKQAARIRMMAEVYGWTVHRIDVSEVFQKGGEEGERIWDETVKTRGLGIVERFLEGGISPAARYEVFEFAA